jgi:hypothetical protein
VKFRKKSVVIEAWQLPAPNDDSTREAPPPWLMLAIVQKQVQVVPEGKAHIVTLEGIMTADVGDWIIQGVKNEIYPCKPDIFAATYDPA